MHILCSFFFFNDTATTEIYTLSLHDALPISCRRRGGDGARRGVGGLRGSRGPHRCAGEIQASPARLAVPRGAVDRKSTRLNSSHGYISYAVFCLKKKKKERVNVYGQHQLKYT